MNRAIDALQKKMTCMSNVVVCTVKVDCLEFDRHKIQRLLQKYPASKGTAPTTPGLLPQTGVREQEGYQNRMPKTTILISD